LDRASTETAGKSEFAFVGALFRPPGLPVEGFLFLPSLKGKGRREMEKGNGEEQWTGLTGLCRINRFFIKINHVNPEKSCKSCP
jgi:hypothetical protein